MFKRMVSALALVTIGLAGSAAADGYAPGKRALSWTGFYVGLNAGAIWDKSDHALTPSGLFIDPLFIPTNPLRSPIGDLDSARLTGGLQVGANYQMGAIVVGVEADFNSSGLKSSDALLTALPSPPLAGTMEHRVDEKLNWFATLRGRLGIAASDRLLIYGTAGWALGHVESSTFVQFSLDGDTYASNFSSRRSGWTAGGGFEYALGTNFTVKGEVLFIDLGSVSYVSQEQTVFPGFTYTTTLDLTEVVARVGVNYKFGGK